MRSQSAEIDTQCLEETGLVEMIDLGIDAIHGQGFQMSFPEGLDRYNFAYYNCPIVLQDESGCREWPPGVSVVYAPENPRYLCAESSDLVNTWFSFRGPCVAACLAAYEIPTNRVLDLGELPFLKPLLEEVRRERMQQALHWRDAVSDLIRAILREYGTLKSELDHEMTPAQRRLERTLRDIRMRVHSDLAHRWTVTQMAALADLHPTWFAMVYTRQFGLSPINDLLTARIKHAEALLTQLPMTVAQIAADCGFANIEHFTRMFHQRMGCSPGQLRGRTKVQEQERNLRKDQ